MARLEVRYGGHHSGATARSIKADIGDAARLTYDARTYQRTPKNAIKKRAINKATDDPGTNRINRTESTQSPIGFI